MASCSGNSSVATMFQSSGSEEELQTLMEERKRKRKQSNRESARRSRMRKQKLIDDLTAEIAELRSQNNRILSSITAATQTYLRVEAENSVLRAQLGELNHRLDSLNDILCFMDNNGGVGLHQGGVDGFVNPFDLGYLNQPIMASPAAFQY